MKNANKVKKSSLTSTPRGAKSETITVYSGRVHKPKEVYLNDVLNFIENAGRRELRIISNVMEVKTIGAGIGSISFNDIGLANVLRFAGSANRRERGMIKEVLKEGAL
jgi:hypothetical protein